MSRRMSILLVVLAIVFGGIVAYNMIRGYMVGKFFSNYEPPAVAVSTVEAKQKNWQPVIPGVGSFAAIQGVEINAQVSGIVKEILFDSGEYVKKGDPLFVIDDSVDQATLKDNKANLVLQKLTYQRQASLFKTGSTSNSEMDKARASLDSAEAAVQQTEALIAQKHIVAPFDGRLGIRQISLGEYISPGETDIVTLQSLDPLYLRFYLPEQNFSKLFFGQSIRLMVDALPGQWFQGKITAVDAKIDTDTHNILVQATVNNQKVNDHFVFMPGMFAKIEVLLPQQEKAIVLPLTAVTYTLYGDSVYIVKNKEKDPKKKPILKVYRQYIKTGEKKGNEVVILEGLKAGDIVVNSGQMKVHNGTRVEVNNSVNLSNVDNVDKLGQ